MVGEGRDGTYFMISLDLMTLRISSITRELTHTGPVSHPTRAEWAAQGARTLLPDEAVVPVVGVVGVSRDGAGAVPDDPKVEFCDHVSRNPPRQSTVDHEPRNSWPNLPECPELYVTSAAGPSSGGSRQRTSSGGRTHRWKPWWRTVGASLSEVKGGARIVGS